ncbi:MAG: alpha/beta hydrolase [Nocardioides sp.]
MSTLTRPQRFKRALIGVVLVVLLAHVGAGWYYSNQIWTDGLDASTPWQPTKDLVINDVFMEGAKSGSVTLIEDQVTNQDIRTAGTFGLIYDGGYGLVTGEPEIVEKRITRPFTLITGQPPRLGQRAAADFFAEPRETLPPQVDVTFPGPLGELKGVFLPGTGKVWAILVHGRGATPAEMFRLMQTTSALGMPSLSINYRNDTGVDPDPSGQHGFGQTEWHDLKAAVDYAHEQGAESIVLGGGSMGGGIVAAYMRAADDTSDIRGLILDSPMLDFAKTVEFGAQQLADQTGVPIPPTVSWSAKRVTSLRFGTDWGEMDYLGDSTWVSVPTLVFHGTKDDLVPIETSRRLAAEAKQVTLVVTDAGHVRSWNVDPAAYDAAVRKFLTPLIS